MRSRSYSVAVGSSLLLLPLLACPAFPERNREEAPRFPAVGEGTKDAGTPDVGDWQEKVDRSSGKAPPTEGAAHVSRNLASEGKKAPLDPKECPQGEMLFEGACTPKDEVSKILAMRERQALEKYRKAKEPKEAAKAAQELLEQQVVQVGKTEDDLDEIIGMLQEEQKKEEEEKKGRRRKK